MRIRNLQALRALAALAVVLFHVSVWEDKMTGPSLVMPADFWPGEAGVDLFFVISGFIMVYIQPKPIVSWRAYGRFMGHRFCRIYPPLWVLLVPLLLVWLVRPHLFNTYANHRVDIVDSIFLIPQNYLPLLAVSWTLIHEIYFYLVVSVALTFSTRGRVIFGGAWFLLVLAGYTVFGATRFHDIRVLQLIFSPFSLTFLLGYFAGLLHGRLRRFSVPGVAGLVLLGLLAFGIGCREHPPTGVYPDNNHLLRFFCYGVPLALVVAGAAAMDERVSIRSPILQKLGDASYSLYLVHVLVIRVFYGAWGMFHPRNVYLLIGGAAVSLWLCLVAGLLYHFWIERPLLRFCRPAVERLFPPAGLP